MTTENDHNEPTYEKQLWHARKLLVEKGREAVNNPYAMIGRQCRCGTCFCCAALQVYNETNHHRETATFEPIRPLRAPDNETPYYVSAPLHAVSHPYVDYGSSAWPSRSYWLVPKQA